MAKNKDYTITFNDQITAASNAAKDISNMGSDVVLKQIKKELYNIISDTIYPIKKSSTVSENKDSSAKEQQLRDKFKINELVSKAVSKAISSQRSKSMIVGGGGGGVKASKKETVVDFSAGAEKIGKAVSRELAPVLGQLKTEGIVSGDLDKLKQEIISKLVSTIKENSPKETTTTLRKVVDSVVDVKETLSGMKEDFKKIRDVRKNGVENIGEVLELANSMTRVFSNFKHIVKNQAPKGIEAVKRAPEAVKKDISTINTRASDINKQVKKSVSDALKEFRSAPKEMLQATIDDFTSTINKVAPTYSNTSFMKTLEAFSGKGINDLDDLISALRKTIKEFPKDIGKSKDSVNDTKEFISALRDLNRVVGRLSDLPKDPRGGRSNWNKLGRISEIIEDTTSKATVILESNFDQVKKELEDFSKKPVSVPVIPEVVSDQKDISKQVKDVSGKQTIDIVPRISKELPASYTEYMEKKFRAFPRPVPKEDKSAGTKKVKPAEPVIYTEVKDFSKDIVKTVSSLKDHQKKTDLTTKENGYLNDLIKKIEDTASRGGKVTDLERLLGSEIDRSSKEARDFYRTAKGVDDIVDAIKSLRDACFSGQPTKLSTTTVLESSPYTGKTWLSIKKPKFAEPVQKVMKYEPSDKGSTLRPMSDPKRMFPEKYDTFQSKAIADAREGLQRSLLKLQEKIVSELSEGLEASKSGWGIVRGSDKQKVTDYFTRASGYNQKISGKQYVLELADIAKIKRSLIDSGSKGVDKYSNEQVVKTFREQQKDFITSENTMSVKIAEIAKWIKNMPLETIKGWKTLNQGQKSFLSNLKKDADASYGKDVPKEVTRKLEAAGKEKVNVIYRETLGEMYTDKVMEKGNLVRKISVPAVSEVMGSHILETASGSQRILPKFATYKTGFENMYEKLTKDNKNFRPEETNYAEDIKKIGLRPAPEQYKEVNEVAKRMIKDLALRGGEYRKFVSEQYGQASVIAAKNAERSKQVLNFNEVLNPARTTNKALSGRFIASEDPRVIEGFIKSMEKAGVSAYDFVKSMETVEFSNIYDKIGQLLEGNDKFSPIRELGKNPSWQRNVRDFSDTIGKLVGTIPIADPSRPRRYAHQGSIVKMEALSSSPFYKGTLDFDSDQQKSFIRDMNLAMRSYFEDTKALKQANMGQDRVIPLDVKTISSLGVPESQAANISEFRPGGRSFTAKDEKDDVSYLKTLRSTGLNMYSDDLTELAPFGQFQQRGRNIASTTNAIKFKPAGEFGVPTTTPLLQSARERDMIEAGKYGSEGYGFNVTAELRNAASTFEDQIVISGKLADVLTSTVKTIVQPDKLGSLDYITKGGKFSFAAEAPVTDIKEGQVLNKSVRSLRNDIEKMDKVFQSVLGIKQEYKGRADEAIIKEVAKVVTVNRGQELNVQMAKIAETFFNYYGRKFSTRYGSKGVAIAPTGGETISGKELSKLFSDKRVSFLTDEEREKAGIGSKIDPRSMGSLMADILKAEVSKGEDSRISKSDVSKLIPNLLSSGNRMMLSMFTDSDLGLTPEKYASKHQAIFEEASRIFKKIGIELKKDAEGIYGITSAYKSKFKDDPSKSLYKEVPIDIMISSYGAAKRGLQTENLELILNNIAKAGSVKDPAVVKTSFDQPTYEKFLGSEDPRLSFSKISAALGYKTSTDLSADDPKLIKDMEDLIKSRTSFKGTEEELRKKAKRLAALEAGGSFYSEVVGGAESPDGGIRKSLVGSKFVEVVENPHQYAPWSRTDVEKQVRGEKLNLPAYGAYSAIFGDQSKFMKQISRDITPDSRKHWEYIKSLQTINPARKEETKSLLDAALRIDVSSLRSFEGTTGKFLPEEIMKRYENFTDLPKENFDIDPSELLNNTILDAVKYPGALNLQIPDTLDPRKRESFYVPSAIARTTYPDPTHAGHRGMDAVSRRLQIVVNRAKSVDQLLEAEPQEDSQELKDKNIGRIINHFKKLRGRVNKTKDVNQLSDILNQLMDPLSTSSIIDESGAVDTRMTYGRVGPKDVSGNLLGTFSTRADYIQDFLNIQKSRNPDNMAKAYKNTISQAIDHLIGPDPRGNTGAFPTRYEETASMFGSKKLSGSVKELQDFASKLGIEPATEEDALKDALAALERAKIDYYNTLANSVMGKTGSVQELMFTRKVPAVMAKAVTAVVDKTDELKVFEEDLRSILEDSGDLSPYLKDLAKQADSIGNIQAEHEKAIKGYKSKGMPVLKQHELGVPEEYAKLLPAEFTRYFEMTKKGELQRFSGPDSKRKGKTLSELLEYRSMLEQNKGQFSPDSLEYRKIESQLKNELTPFIESIRFPFTGVSSVQPYEAKLIKEGQYGGLAKHSLMAPGIPEMDFSKFDAVKKSIESMMDSLDVERRKEYDKESPNYERIDRITQTIENLDEAIANVIPMYVAQQQKLDFDGDQIEIHSAKTAEARKEIEKHYKSLTDYGLSKGSTEQAHRREFTYGAKVQSTGKYTLAEQQLAFEKKFPESEGFSFLQRPFLTENLEYLKPEEQLKVLSQVPGTTGKARGPLASLIDIIPSAIKDEDLVGKLTSDLMDIKVPYKEAPTSQAEGEVDEDLYLKELLGFINKQDQSISGPIIEAMRKGVYDIKEGNAINAQLFKINTGRDTEALNRLLKVFERNVGMGAGLIDKTKEYKMSESVSRRFPTGLKSVTAPIGSELTTMMNEFIRVGIQKGMDVKHAGETPIATEMVQLISKGPKGIDTLIEKINNKEGAYGDLKDFSEANEKALKFNMGALRTSDIYADAKKIAEGRGHDYSKIAEQDRKGVEDYIVKNIGFEGFLYELGAQIREAAYDGIKQGMESLPEEKRASILKGRDIEDYASKMVAKQMKGKGINVLGTSEKPTLPLYGFRTSSASTEAQLNEYKKRYKVDEHKEVEKVLSGSRPVGESKIASNYVRKLQAIEATAINLGDALRDANTVDKSAGSYGQMASSSLDALKESAKISKIIANQADKERKERGFEVIGMDPMDRLMDPSTMGVLAKRVSSKEDINEREDLLDSLSKAVGVSRLPSLEKLDLRRAYLPRAQALADRDINVGISSGDIPANIDEDVYNKLRLKYAEKYIGKAISIKESDLIVKVARTQTGNESYLDKTIGAVDPKEYLNKQRSRIDTIQQQNKDIYFKKAKESVKYSTEGERLQSAPSFGAGGYTAPPRGPSAGAGMPMSGGIVPVHLVSIEPNLYSVLGGTLSSDPSKNVRSDSFSIKNLDRVNELVEKITGGLNTAKDSSFEVKYRASGLSGGQKSFEKQVKEIKKNMMGMKDSSPILTTSSPLGTAIHAKLESKYKERPNTLIEEPVKYVDPKAGEVSGTIDVLNLKSDGKSISEVIDVKTISEENYIALKKLVSELTGGKEFTDINVNALTPEVLKQSDLGSYFKKSKLGDVASQLNLYLKALESKDPEATKAPAYAHFYSNMDESLPPIKVRFEFDQERLDRDMQAIVAAREQVLSSGKGFAPTASFETAKKIASDLKKPENAITPEEIDELLRLTRDNYQNVRRSLSSRYASAPSKGEVFKGRFPGRPEKSPKDAGIDPSDPYSDMDVSEFARSSSITQHGWLVRQHSIAREHQRSKYNVSVDDDGIDQFPESIQQLLKKTSYKKPAGSELSSEIKKLEAAGDITQGQISKAWKAYRIAVGDYYVRKLKEALEHLRQQEKGSPEEVNAANAYENLIRKFQENVKKSFSKPSDIYSEGGVYLDSDVAKFAGTWESPEERHKRAADVLGDKGGDNRLREIFKNISRFEDDEVPIPRDLIRDTLEQLIGLDKNLIDLYTDPEIVSREGSKMFQDWDFASLKDGVSRLKQAVEKKLSFGAEEDYTAPQLVAMKEVLKELRDLEKLYVNVDLTSPNRLRSNGKIDFPTLIDIPKQLTKPQQEAMIQRNVSLIEDYFSRSEEGGGPKKGEAYVYDPKIYAANNRVVGRPRYSFFKQGDRFDKKTGEMVGVFSREYKNLNEIVGKGNRTFAIAIDRVIKWGAAAKLVYGGMGYIKDSVDQISDIEYAMAKLQMVMNPLKTDFDELQRSAVDFAKTYGTGVEDVLSSMRVFAQQGLGQMEVVDRTRTSTVASNITDLSTTDATEALTAAMKVFRSEGESSMRFLDSWSEVESKAAIKAGDLADAIKKAASAGKNAGFTFDQLNGMVAAIGSVTRQTGKEVGTSLRFIFNRLNTEKGPAALSSVGVSTKDQQGQLRSGFDILSDLQSKWKDQSNASKLNLAQALGGTRQYNAVLTLMDNWDEVLNSMTNSINSKGSAERRNMALMKTYAKQLEKVKATMSELKIEVGKLVLPSFKVGLSGIRGFLEIVNSIPSGLKLAAAAAVSFFTFMSKGKDLLDGVSNSLSVGAIRISELISSFKSSAKISLFEIFGIGDTKKDADILFGLDTIKEGAKFKDLQSPLSKLGYILVETAKKFNTFLGVVVGDSSSAVDKVGGFIKTIAEMIKKLSSFIGLGASFVGLPSVGAVMQSVGSIVSTPLKFVGSGLEKTGALGQGASAYLKENMNESSASIMKTLGPLMGTTVAAALATPAVIRLGKSLLGNADSYRDQRSPEIDLKFEALSDISNLLSSYRTLEKKRAAVGETPIGDEGTSSLLRRQLDLYQRQSSFNEMAAKYDSKLVSGYGERGDVYLNRTGKDLERYLSNKAASTQFSLALSQSDIVSKYASDATETGGIQNWKYTLKEISKNMPLGGPMFEKMINVGPKKALVKLQEELSKLLSARNKNPLSNAFDAAIEELQEKELKLKAALEVDAKEITDRLDSLITDKLSTRQIDLIVNQESLKEAFEVIATANDKYRMTGVTAEDVKAKYSMMYAFPGYKGAFEPTADLTLDKLKSQGIVPRGPLESGKTAITSGDFVKLTKEFAKANKIAGRQAVVGQDASGKFILTFVNSLDGTIKSLRDLTANMLSGNVEVVTSMQDMTQVAESAMTRTAVSSIGASAGMLGLDKKTLNKRQVNFGEKFYSDIASEFLVQTNKGYDRTTDTYGTPSYKKDYEEEFLKSFYEPFEERAGILQSIKTGDTSPDRAISGLTGEQLKLNQSLLQNNSAVFQFRLAIEDLGKTLESSQQSIKTMIDIEEDHYKQRKQLSTGFMEGISEGLEGYKTSTYNYRDLNVKQRALTDVPGLQGVVQEANVAEKTYAELTRQADAVISTLRDLERIDETSKGFATRFKNPEEMNEYRDIVGYTGGDKGAAEIVLAVSSATEQLIDANTELSDIRIGIFNLIDLFRSPEEIVENAKKDLQISSESADSNIEVARALADMAKLTYMRDKLAETPSNAKVVSELDEVLNEASINLLKNNGVDQFNYKKVNNMAKLMGRSDPKVPKDYYEDLAYGAISRGLTAQGVDANALIERMRTFKPKDWFETGKAEKRMRKSADEAFAAMEKGKETKGFFNTDMLGKSALSYAVFNGLQNATNNEDIAALEKRIANVEKEKSKLKEKSLPTVEVDKQLYALNELKNEKLSKKQFYDIGQTLSVTPGLAYLGSKAFGAGEGSTAKLMLASTAIRGLMKYMLPDISKNAPDYYKKFEEKMGKVSDKLSEAVKNDEKIDLKKVLEEKGPRAKEYIQGASKEFINAFVKDMKENASKFTKRSEEETVKQTSKVAKDLQSVQGRKEINSIKSKVEQELKASGVSGARKIEAAGLVGLIVTALNTANASYATDSSISTFANTSKSQQDAIIDLLKTAPDEFAKALDEIISEDRVNREMGRTGEPLYGKSRALSVEENKEVLRKKALADKAVIDKDRAEQAKIQRQANAYLSRITNIKQFELKIEDFKRGIGQALRTDEISQRFKPTPSVGRSLSGFSGAVPIALLNKEMSADQRLYAEGGEDLKKSLTAYTGLTKTVDYGTQLLSMLSENRETLKENIAGYEKRGDQKAADRLKKDLEKLNLLYESTSLSILKSSNLLQDASVGMRVINKYQEALTNLQNSLDVAAVDRMVKSFAGLEEYIDNTNKMLGGSHPDAIVEITPEQQRLAQKYGMELDPNTVTQFDIRRLNLQDQLFNTTDLNEQDKIRQQIMDLPAERESKLRYYKQREYDQTSKSMLEPFKNFYSNIVRMRMTDTSMDSGTNEKLLDLQNRLREALSEATTRVSTKDQIASIEKYRDTMVAESPGFSGTQAFRLIEEQLSYLKSDQAPDTVYKGIGFDLRNDIMALKDTLAGMFVNDEGQTLRDAVTSPLQQEFREVQNLLRDLITASGGKVKEATPKEDSENKAATFYERLQKHMAAMSSEKMSDLASFHGFNFGGQAKAFGDHPSSLGGGVSGPGGPREDKVKAFLSPGEFVIRAHSARQIGYDKLNFMNKKGAVPGFNDGGQVNAFADGTDYGKYNTFQEAIDISMRKRSSSIKKDLDEDREKSLAIKRKLRKRLADWEAEVKIAHDNRLLERLGERPAKSIKAEETKKHPIFEDFSKDKKDKDSTIIESTGILGKIAKNLTNLGDDTATAFSKSIKRNWIDQEGSSKKSLNSNILEFRREDFEKGKAKGFADGGILTPEDIKAAHAYFTDSDAQTPVKMDPEESDFDPLALKNYLSLYKSSLPEDLKEAADIKSARSLKDLYNTLADYADSGTYEDSVLFPTSVLPMMSKYSKVLKNSDALSGLFSKKLNITPEIIKKALGDRNVLNEMIGTSGSRADMMRQIKLDTEGEGAVLRDVEKEIRSKLGLADGGILTSADIKEAHKYFTDSEAATPSKFDVEAKDKYDEKALKNYLELYKSTLPAEVRNLSDIKNASNLKDLYNSLADYSDSGEYSDSDLFPTSVLPMLDRYSKILAGGKALSGMFSKKLEITPDIINKALKNRNVLKEMVGGSGSRADMMRQIKLDTEGEGAVIRDIEEEIKSYVGLADGGILTPEDIKKAHKYFTDSEASAPTKLDPSAEGKGFDPAALKNYLTLYKSSLPEELKDSPGVQGAGSLKDLYNTLVDILDAGDYEESKLFPKSPLSMLDRYSKVLSNSDALSGVFSKKLRITPENIQKALSNRNVLGEVVGSSGSRADMLRQIKIDTEGEGAVIRDIEKEIRGKLGLADGGGVGYSWLEDFDRKSKQFEKATYSGKAAEKVDPDKVKFFTNVATSTIPYDSEPEDTTGIELYKKHIEESKAKYGDDYLDRDLSPEYYLRRMKGLKYVPSKEREPLKYIPQSELSSNKNVNITRGIRSEVDFATDYLSSKRASLIKDLDTDDLFSFSNLENILEQTGLTTLELFTRLTSIMALPIEKIEDYIRSLSKNNDFPEFNSGGYVDEELMTPERYNFFMGERRLPGSYKHTMGLKKAYGSLGPDPLEDRLEDLDRWGYESSKAAMDREADQARALAKDRAYMANLKRIEEKKKLQKMEASNALFDESRRDSEVLNYPSISKYYDKKRGINIYKDHRSGVRFGKVSKSAIRSGEFNVRPESSIPKIKEAYKRPLGIVEDKANYTPGFFGLETFDDLTVRELPPTGSLPPHVADYVAWITKIKEAADYKGFDLDVIDLSKPDDELAKDFSSIEIAMAKIVPMANEFLKVANEPGTNLFKDPRLQKTVIEKHKLGFSVAPWNALEKVEGKGFRFVSNKDPKDSGYLSDEVSRKKTISYLEQIRRVATSPTVDSILREKDKKTEPLKKADLTGVSPISMFIDKKAPSKAMLNYFSGVGASERFTDSFNKAASLVASIATPTTTDKEELNKRVASIVPSLLKISNLKPDEVKEIFQSYGLPIPSKDDLDKISPAQRNSVPKFLGGIEFAHGGIAELHRGETVLNPKETKAMEVANQALNVAPIKIDADDLLKKLSSIELKVEDKEVKVEDSVIKVDSSEAVTNLNNSISSSLNQLSNTLSSSLQDVNVVIDVSSASSQLSDAIKNAAAAAKFNIPDITATGAGSAGAASFDRTAEMVVEVHDKLIAATTKFDDEVKVLSVRMEDMGREIKGQVTTELTQQIAGVQSEIARVESNMSSMSDNVTSQINRVEMGGQEAARLAKQALNFIN